MNEDAQLRLAESLTADTPRLIEFLPYLLQDFHELGSSPEDMVELLRTNTRPQDVRSVLDLGCGKGAVSLAMARELGVSVTGIDAIPAFIEEAVDRSIQDGTSDLCTYICEDITDRSFHRPRFDCTIYGAVGRVLGEPERMLEVLRHTVRAGGYLLLDDAHAAGGESEYPSRVSWNRLFGRTGWQVVDERIASDEDIAHYAEELGWIEQRAAELIDAYPAKRELFARYVETQRAEYEDLAGDLVGITWLLQKR